MKILHLLDLYGGSDSGPVAVVRQLTSALSERGEDVTVLAAGDAVWQADKVDFACFPHQLSALSGLRRLRLSAGLSRAVGETVPNFDVVHSHGLWIASNFYATRECQKHRKPLVMSPHGMLSPSALKFSRIQKGLAWWLGQRNALNRAACVLATSEQEYLDIRRAGITRPPVAIISHGVTVGEGPADPRDPSSRTVLYLGRLHPIKNLESLIHAWARVEEQHPSWKLLLAGPDELGYGEHIRTLVRTLGVKRAKVSAPVYGEEKTELISSVDALVLPSLTENFGLVVAEAMAAGLPVVCTTGAPWSEVERRGCGFWVDPTVDGLSTGLNAMMSTTGAQLSIMGQRGRSWMLEEFSWATVSCKTAALYRFLVGGGNVPTYIRYS